MFEINDDPINNGCSLNNAHLAVQVTYKPDDILRLLLLGISNWIATLLMINKMFDSHTSERTNAKEHSLFECRLFSIPGIIGRSDVRPIYAIL